MMRKETMEAPRPCDGVVVDLWETERRYRGAKAVLLAAEGENISPEASEEFLLARAALRLALEEIWPERESGCGN